MGQTGMEYLIRFEAERCIQCHGCETACKSWRGLEPGVRYRRVFNIWHGKYPLITSSSLSLSCLHCVEPSCAAACPEGAIFKEPEYGLVHVDEAACSGCGVCVEACGYGVPQITGDGVMRKCDVCIDHEAAGEAIEVPPCVDTCPGTALILERVDRSEKVRHERLIQKLYGETRSV